MKQFEIIPTSGRFPLGRVVATPGAIEALAQANVDGRELLSKRTLPLFVDISKVEFSGHNMLTGDSDEEITLH